jgi:hypothetical protein
MTDARNIIRLVLADDVDREQVETAAWDLNWLWWDEVQRTADTPHEVIWKTADDESRIHLIEDFLVGLNYLMFQGKDAAALANDASSKLPVYSKKDIAGLHKDASGRDERIKAVYVAALAASPSKVDRELLALLEAAFKADDSEVRQAAVAASGYVGWEPLKEELRRLAESDPDEGVKRDAGVMLEGIEQNRPGGAA